jgi:hypothetical protein
MPDLTPRVDLPGRPVPEGEQRVSWQSREKKRRYKRAVKKAKRTYAEESARRWYLTLAKKKTACACCGRVIGPGGEMVYRHEPREIRCLPCASRDPESKAWRRSLRWEKAKWLPSRESATLSGTPEQRTNAKSWSSTAGGGSRRPHP